MTFGEEQARIEREYGNPRPRTDTVVNRQYAAELAVVAAARASAGAGTADSEAVVDGATDALMELARWMASCGGPPRLETVRPGDDPVVGVPLAEVPTPNRGVAWPNGRDEVYRIVLVTHIRVTPLGAFTGSWSDDLPLAHSTGTPFLLERLSGFKFRTAYVALLDRLAAELDEILSDDGDSWTWSDGDDPRWHPEAMLATVRRMRDLGRRGEVHGAGGELR